MSTLNELILFEHDLAHNLHTKNYYNIPIIYNTHSDLEKTGR
jgi:hypothetical protein